MRNRFLFVTLVVCLLNRMPPIARAQDISQLLPPVPPRTTPVGLPQDAGPHDKESTIEWWYANAFLTAKDEAGKAHRYAFVVSFFRTGLTPTKKGHYLIYALTDLDTKRVIRTASILDKGNANLLKSVLPLLSMRNPNDPRPMQLMALLQKNHLPAPHQLLAEDAHVTATPRFQITMGGNSFAQTTDDAREWDIVITDPQFNLTLHLAQPTAPPMLVGGEGKTGLRQPDDMYYVSLTRPQATGTLALAKGPKWTVEGQGWIDRQWGRTWAVGDNGWDWWGLHLSDGSELIVYQLHDNSTGRILRREATLLKADGTLVVDKDVRIALDISNVPNAPRGMIWKDPASGAAFPTRWTIYLPSQSLRLSCTRLFPAQTIPVIGIGDAIWEGVVLVDGIDSNGNGGGKHITGQGYMELVGYHAKKPVSSQKTTAKSPPTR